MADRFRPKTATCHFSGVGELFAPLARLWNREPAVSDDAQLIDQALRGQSESFGRLVLKYQDRLYNTIVHVVGHAEDARDIVQEAFVQAFLKLETFRRESGFYTWLYRIAFNASMTHRRRKRPIHSTDCGRENQRDDPPDDQDTPVEAVERKEQCGLVQQAIGRLDHEQRTVLVLREIDGCNYETIAQMLDIPVGTVRSRLHRARMQLKELLEEELGARDLGN